MFKCANLTLSLVRLAFRLDGYLLSTSFYIFLEKSHLDFYGLSLGTASFYSRVHATLHSALYVRRSVRRSECQSVTLLLFFINFIL